MSFDAGAEMRRIYDETTHRTLQTLTQKRLSHVLRAIEDFTPEPYTIRVENGLVSIAFRLPGHAAAHHTSTTTCSCGGSCSCKEEE